MAERCHFAHGPEDLRMPNKPNTFVAAGGVGGVSNYKTVPCKYYMEQGICNFGDKCSFAHGHTDLRAKTVVPQYTTNYEVDPATGVLRLANHEEEVVLTLVNENDNDLNKIKQAASLIKSNLKEEAKEIIEELYKNA